MKLSLIWLGANLIFFSCLSINVTAQIYLNSPTYVSTGTMLTNFGEDAIFGSGSTVEIDGDINILSNSIYMDSLATITGNGKLAIINPVSGALPWAAHLLDANGAIIGADLIIETTSIQMQNLSYPNLASSSSYDLLILKEMQFDTGIVNTAAGLVHFLEGSLYTGSSSISYVNGTVRKTGNTAFTFPVGDAVNFAPVGISAPALATDHFTCAYYNTDPHGLGVAIDPSLALISSCEYWNVQRTGGSASVSVSLSWDTRSCGVTDPSLLRIAHWNGSLWEDKGNVWYSGSASSGSLSSIINNSFSPFTLASTSIVNPLPVSLASFTAECIDSRNAIIKWQTLSELNNDYFSVEQSSDLQEWMVVSTKPGSNNSNAALEYECNIIISGSSTNYYRLRQVDFDGQFRLYGPISLHCENMNVPSIYPNPLEHDIFYVSLPDKNENQWSYTVIDATGKSCLAGTITNAIYEEGIMVDMLNPGTYYVSLRDQINVYVFPLIKIK